jgi:hypothetical protein
MARSNLATNLLFCYERKVIATRLMTFLRFTATTTIYHSNLEVQAKRLADDAGNKFWQTERRGHKISDTEKPFSVNNHNSLRPQIIACCSPPLAEKRAEMLGQSPRDAQQ